MHLCDPKWVWVGLQVWESQRTAAWLPCAGLTQKGSVSQLSLATPLQASRMPVCLSVYLSVCLKQMQELPLRAFFGGREKDHICISGVFFACREAELVTHSGIYWALTMCSETKHQACSISFYLHRNHISWILSSLYRRRSTANELVNFSMVSLEQWFSKWWSFAGGEVKYFKKYPRLCSTPRDAYTLALGYILGIWNVKSSLGDSNVQPTLRTNALRQVVEEVGFEPRSL